MDMALAAFLYMKHTLANVAEAESDRAKFVFEGDPEIIKTEVNGFYRHEALVEPRDYFYALRSIKSALYNARESKGSSQN